MNHCEEVRTEFFISCRQPSHVFHSAEEALDDVAHTIESFVMRDRFSGV